MQELRDDREASDVLVLNGGHQRWLTPLMARRSPSLGAISAGS
jgi:hypothetical protein